MARADRHRGAAAPPRRAARGQLDEGPPHRDVPDGLRAADLPEEPLPRAARRTTTRATRARSTGRRSRRCTSATSGCAPPASPPAGRRRGRRGGLTAVRRGGRARLRAPAMRRLTPSQPVVLDLEEEAIDCVVAAVHGRRGGDADAGRGGRRRLHPEPRPRRGARVRRGRGLPEPPGTSGRCTAPPTPAACASSRAPGPGSPPAARRPVPGSSSRSSSAVRAPGASRGGC